METIGNADIGQQVYLLGQGAAAVARSVDPLRLFFLSFHLSIHYILFERDSILAKYSQETEQSRRIGNTVVVIYVILTFVSLICAARCIS